MRRSEKGNPLDLRAWLEEARKLGEVRDVRGADWNLELGAISELNVKKDAPPALLFDEIKGYPKGFRVLTCSTMDQALARAGGEAGNKGSDAAKAALAMANLRAQVGKLGPSG